MPSDLESKISQLEQNNLQLGSTVARLAAGCLNHSSKLVIGGLQVNDGTDLKKVITAVLKTVHTALDPRDMVSVQQPSKRTSRVEQTKHETDDHGALPHVDGSPTEKTGAIRRTTGTASTTGSSLPLASSPVFVTMSSRPVALEIIKAKVRFGKLHTSQILPAPTCEATHSLLAQGLVNINEYLPRETFVLHRLVRQKARAPDSGFISFIRNGQIYVRRKKGDMSVPIMSPSDLDHFLLR